MSGGLSVLSPYLQEVAKHHSTLVSTILPYTPFSIFSVIHALRVATAFKGAATAGGYVNRLSNWQIAIVPAVLILGGTTVTSVLLGQIPGWVISPIPVLTYTFLPLVLFKNVITDILLSIPALPLNILFSVVDGFSRIQGITTFGVDAVLAHPNKAIANSPWTMILIGTLAGGGGGLIVPAFRGFHADWAFGTPSWAREGPAIDVWGATVVALIYSTLIDAHPFFRTIPAFLLPKEFLPINYLDSKVPRPLLSVTEAKYACSLFLFALLSLRLILLYVITPAAPKAKPVQAATIPVTPTAKTTAIAATPKKSSSSKKAAAEKKDQ